MTVERLRWEDPEILEVVPKVLTRVIVTPSAAPWDQNRVADLDARLNAPLPLTEVAYQLKRLEPWRPRRAGRFAAAYLRRTEVGDGLSVACPVDGQSLTFSFISPQHRSAQMRQLALVGGLSALLTLLVLAATSSAVMTRLSQGSALTTLEASAANRDRQTARGAALLAQARALDLVEADSRRLDQLAQDLVWTTSYKAPDVQVEGFHWDRGYFAVEVRGDASPFVAAADREVKRAGRPARQGVWLWGVSQRQADGAVP